MFDALASNGATVCVIKNYFHTYSCLGYRKYQETTYVLLHIKHGLKII